MPSFLFRRKFCSRWRCRRLSVFKRKQKAKVQIDHLPQTLEVPKCASRFMHLRHLTLSMYLGFHWKFDILRLVDLLQAAPFLEHFELTIDEILLPLYDEDLIPSVPRWPHDHLKTASFRGFVANIDLIVLAIYVLNNAESLELMTVQTTHEDHRMISEELLRREDLRNVLNIL